MVDQSDISISVVIVSYNSLRYIDECLQGLADLGPADEVILVDNHGRDGVVEHVRTTYPGVSVLPFEDNLGFGHGCNRGARASKGDVLVMLNPDAFTDARTLRELAEQLVSSGAAACGPRIINRDGSHQVGDAGWAPSIQSVTGHSFLLQRLLPAAKSLYVTNKRLLSRAELDVDWVSGACMLIQRYWWDRIDGFDERIFMYGEDVEWGIRTKKAGGRISYFPAWKVTHIQGASQKAEGERYYSEKWISAKYDFLLSAHGKLYAQAAMASLAAGFALQAAAGAVAAPLLRSGRLKLQVLHKFRYARAGVNLMVRGTAPSGTAPAAN